MSELLKKLKHFLRVMKVIYFRKLIHVTRKIKPPGFEGVSVWDILVFFIWTIRKGLVGTRASSLAFHFFLAMIPFGLALVISSAYIPFFDLRQDIIPILSGFVPELLIGNFIDGLADLENSTVNSMISVGFVMALYFISNGFLVMITAFNSSKIEFKKRSWLSTRLISLGLVIGFLFSIIITLFFIVWERKLLLILGEDITFIANNFNLFYYGITFLIIGSLLYFSISFLYYIAPSDRSTFKFMSAGSTLSTSLIILIFLGYSYYVTHFANYNALYGSVGTIIIVLLWIYFNAYALMIGFELNASIHGAMMKKKTQEIENLLTEKMSDTSTSLNNSDS
jgi:membrane protein